jgi:diguanylate cyclase (GGDEF)-like protein
VKGGAARLEESHDGALGDPVAALPELKHCLAGHEASAEAVTTDGMRVLWLPIWFGDKATTCLEIRDDKAFSRETVYVIGGIVGVYRNFQNLLDYSERDSLTGLLNRKTFDDQLARMLQSSHERDPRLPGQPERRQHHAQEKQWLAVVDVDHFKAVNDKFGHLYGDEVLILIANLLQSSFRAQDRVFRFGGEEFVVLLRSTTLDNAWKIIERFRANVESHIFPQVGQVTVSVGFVSISAYDSPVVTLGHADQALYYAKSNGRNRACHYDDLVAHGLLQTVASNDTAEFF